MALGRLERLIEDTQGDDKWDQLVRDCRGPFGGERRVMWLDEWTNCEIVLNRPVPDKSLHPFAPLLEFLQISLISYSHLTLSVQRRENVRLKTLRRELIDEERDYDSHTVSTPELMSPNPHNFPIQTSISEFRIRIGHSSRSFYKWSIGSLRRGNIIQFNS